MYTVDNLKWWPHEQRGEEVCVSTLVSGAVEGIVFWCTNPLRLWLNFSVLLLLTQWKHITLILKEHLRNFEKQQNRRICDGINTKNTIISLVAFFFTHQGQGDGTLKLCHNSYLIVSSEDYYLISSLLSYFSCFYFFLFTIS